MELIHVLFSHASEFAIRGLAELAGRANNGQPVRLDEIVSGTDLPRDYLAKLFRTLVRGGKPAHGDSLPSVIC